VKADYDAETDVLTVVFSATDVEESDERCWTDRE
jgi:hypothetical protein